MNATTASSPIRIAVIGSGPAGFYAAGHLLAHAANVVEVDMFERLPTPWGLVRSGVAPDHPKIKSVTRIYEKTAAHPRFRYFGNVELGADITRKELVEHYHAIVYATGSLTDRAMDIAGEDLPGSWAATDFVGWYNGHPDYRDLEFDLSHERAVVIGNGNVALDVARMLVLSHAELSKTDTADHTLDVLQHSNVREVVVIGRRGPAQAAFTNPELRELGDMDDVHVDVDAAELQRALAIPDPNMSPTAERNVAALRAYAETPASGSRSIALRFLMSPVELRGDANGVREIELMHNVLQADDSGALRATPTGETEVIEAGLVMRAIGYRGVALPEVPFDERHHVIPNAKGRVLDPEDATHRPGEYVVGWIKRGPTGVIGTNKKDAQETVDALLEDLEAGRLADPPSPDPSAVERLLRERKPALVDYAGWELIDHHERSRGEPHGRPRVKVTDIDEMLRIAAAEAPNGNDGAENDHAGDAAASARYGTLGTRG
jgi:ferredoxin--NADP+ reductase